AVRRHARSARTLGLAVRAGRAADAGVADLARLAGQVAARAVRGVGRDAHAVAAQQPALALARTALAHLPAAALLAARAAVLGIGRRVHARRPAGDLRGVASRRNRSARPGLGAPGKQENVTENAT